MFRVGEYAEFVVSYGTAEILWAGIPKVNSTVEFTLGIDFRLQRPILGLFFLKTLDKTPNGLYNNILSAAGVAEWQTRWS